MDYTGEYIDAKNMTVTASTTACTMVDARTEQKQWLKGVVLYTGEAPLISTIVLARPHLFEELYTNTTKSPKHGLWVGNKSATYTCTYVPDEQSHGL